MFTKMYNEISCKAVETCRQTGLCVVKRIHHGCIMELTLKMNLTTVVVVISDDIWPFYGFKNELLQIFLSQIRIAASMNSFDS